MRYISFILIALTVLSCKKDWLEEKPSKSFVVPTTLKDCQAILDNSSSEGNFSKAFNDGQGGLGEMGAGDYFVTEATFGNIFTNVERNIYRWKQAIYEGEVNIPDWNYPYNRIFASNVVLEALEDIEPFDNIEQAAWNLAKGGALFHRAYNHYDIAQNFCMWFTEATAHSDLGIPLRLSSDFNEVSTRSTVYQTYNQIITDLRDAADLLPNTLPTTNLYKLRPTKVAAFAMLARVYLSMRNYDSAFYYSDKALLLYDRLYDYNNLAITNTNNPIPQFNDEVIFHTRLTNYFVYGGSRCIAVPELYSLYTPDDIRKAAFFRTSGNRVFRGSYDGTSLKFSGLATDELYLIRSECNALKGNVDAALNDLNSLLQMRWAAGTYVPYAGLSQDQAIDLIRTERRKELCFRGLRWTDLRRFNQEQDPITLERTIGGETFRLEPNDKRYVLPIPDEVIRMSGMQQNER